MIRLNLLLIFLLHVSMFDLSVCHEISLSFSLSPTNSVPPPLSSSPLSGGFLHRLATCIGSTCKAIFAPSLYSQQFDEIPSQWRAKQFTRCFAPINIRNAIEKSFKTANVRSEQSGIIEHCYVDTRYNGPVYRIRLSLAHVEQTQRKRILEAFKKEKFEVFEEPTQVELVFRSES
jgi:hypothetical protein